MKYFNPKLVSKYYFTATRFPGLHCWKRRVWILSFTDYQLGSLVSHDRGLLWRCINPLVRRSTITLMRSQGFGDKWWKWTKQDKIFSKTKAVSLFAVDWTAARPPQSAAIAPDLMMQCFRSIVDLSPPCTGADQSTATSRADDHIQCIPLRPA